MSAEVTVSSTKQAYRASEIVEGQGEIVQIKMYEGIWQLADQIIMAEIQVGQLRQLLCPLRGHRPCMSTLMRYRFNLCDLFSTGAVHALAAALHAKQQLIQHETEGRYATAARHRSR